MFDGLRIETWIILMMINLVFILFTNWYLRKKRARISSIPSAKKEVVRPRIDNFFRRGSDGRLYLPSHSSRKENLRHSGDGWSVFSGLKMRVLLIRGSESPYTTDDLVFRMRELKPDLLVKTIQGADHGVPFTHSKEFMEAVRGFLVG